MQATLAKPPRRHIRARADLTPDFPAAPLPAEPEPIRVFVAYQNADAGRRAIAIAGLLARELTGATSFEPSLWNFDVITGRYGSAAAAAARGSDIIIFIADDTISLPNAVDRWRNEAALRKRSGPIMVELLGANRDWKLDIHWGSTVDEIRPAIPVNGNS